MAVPQDAPSQATPSTAKQRPTWAIAHRVLTKGGVTTALKHGANALEIDTYAWKQGWWADHDGSSFPRPSWGDTMSDMFDQVAEEHVNGRHVSFVWLDIKNPDYCDSSDPKWRHCSVAALRDMARKKLESKGIRVLYGFWRNEGGSGWKNTIADLNSKEAVAYSGSYEKVRDGYAKYGPKIPGSQRVMDHGHTTLGSNLPLFGTDFDKILKALAAARKDRDAGKLAQTAGWTVGKGDKERAAALLDSSGKGARVDSLIYGYRMSCYPDGVSGKKGCGTDDSAVRESLSYITDYVRAHPDTRRMATPKDIPFGS